MSRSGYCDGGDLDPTELGRWRAAVNSAIRGCWGQAFLTEMAAALDAMPVKELITEDIVRVDEELGPQVCAIGSVALAKGLDVSSVDPEDPHMVSRTFGIAPCLASEIAYENDEAGLSTETAAERWTRMREWVRRRIIPVASESNSDATERAK